MPKLKRRAHTSRQAFQKVGEHGLIRFEIWRELEEKRAEALSALQGFQRAEKAHQEFFRTLQPLDMR